MKIRTSQLFLFITRLILTIALLFFIFSKINFSSIWQALVTANQTYILLAGILLLPYIFLESYKWHLLAKELHSKNSFWDSMKLYLCPNRAITIVKSKGRKLKSGSISFVNGASEVWIAFFFVLLGGQRLFTKSSSVLILAVVIAIILLLYQFRRVNIAITHFAPFKFLKAILRSFTLVSWSFSNILLILSFLTMLVFLLQSYLLLLAFSPVSASVIFFVFPLVFLTNLIPLTIGSLGIREVVAIYLLFYFNVSAEIAVSVSLLLFLFDIFIPAIMGISLSTLGKKHHG